MGIFEISPSGALSYKATWHLRSNDYYSSRNYASRLIGNIHVDGADASGRIIVRSSLQYTEYRLEQRHLAGEVYHKLETDGDGGWRLHLKRVNLVNCDSVMSNLEFFL